MEVYDPVTEGLEGGRGQAPPDGGDLAVVEGLGHLVQLSTHPNLSCQGLGGVGGRSQKVLPENTGPHLGILFQYKGVEAGYELISFEVCVPGLISF